MNHFAAPSFHNLKLALLGIIFLTVGCNTKSLASNPSGPAQRAAEPILSSNDISWLFPAPTRASDFANLIAVSQVTTPAPIWTDAVFKRFLEIASTSSEVVQADGTKVHINLPQAAQSIDAWYIAGVRIDPGAPGLSTEIHNEYGQLPEIRLIIQPVIKNPDGSPKVLDIAGHLIFDFVTRTPDPSPQGKDCFPRPVPDTAAFNSVIADLVSLRNKLSDGKFGNHAVSTVGVPLGVHPGLADPGTVNAVRAEMLSFLQKHLVAERLGSMAVAALPSPAPAPWIFLSILAVPPGVIPALPSGGFIPVHGPTLDGTQFAQMLNPKGTNPRAVPAPQTNNLNPITCRNAAVLPTSSLPIEQRKGVSTSAVFANPSMPADQAKQILDTIADPQKSFFFNTDCISCHTETTLTMDVLQLKEIPGINRAALPNGLWDVRNFGWGDTKSGMQATVTRRAANETAAAVASINSERLSIQQ